MAYAGDWRGARLFRERTYAMCGIDAHAEADAVLVVIHGLAHSGKATRRWHDQTRLVESIEQRKFRTEWCGGSGGCKPLRMLVQGMEGLSFCEQAALYARSRVVVTHHGASLANGMFLRAASVMVEVNKQWDNLHPPRFTHTFDGAGYAGLFLSTGVAYIGARVAYGVWVSRATRNSGHADPTDGMVRWHLDAHPPPHYDFNDASMEIGINATRWDDVLRAIDEIVILHGPPRPPQPPLLPSPPPAPKASPPATTTKAAAGAGTGLFEQLRSWG